MSKNLASNCSNSENSDSSELGFNQPETDLNTSGSTARGSSRVPTQKNNHRYCANQGCFKPKHTRRKFQNRSSFYCIVKNSPLFTLQDCAKVIDDKEYCHICYRLNDSVNTLWIACDLCSKWYHVACDETHPQGTADLSEVMQGVNFDYSCICCKEHSDTVYLQPLS